MQKNSSTKAIVGVVVAAVLIGIIVLLPKKQQTSDATIPVVSGDSTSTATKETQGNIGNTSAGSESINPNPPASTYKDGTYSAEGNYNSPAGFEGVKVSLTLKNDVITDASVVGEAKNPNSIKFQGQFISGYKALVVGKNIDEVTLTKVSGSSLTPKGFNDAVAKIKAQASA